MQGIRVALAATIAVGLLTGRPQPLAASPASDALRAKAIQEVYDLDDVRAMATWREATVADPEDAAAWRGLAGAIMAHIGMLRGTMTVDSYLGRVATRVVTLPPPPPELAREFNAAITKATALARQRVAARPKDAQARYELGAALGLRASYIATVDGGMLAGFRAAREAFGEHERVLALNASRADAGLVVGTYRYLVSALSMPMRVVAYVAGFGGGKDKGLNLVEGAAAYPGDNQADAEVALLLLYNREKRYDAALKLLTGMRARYPRNRLLWLETGSTLLRAERPAEAERMLDEGIALTTRDTRPRMLGEEALWYYRRGSARAALGHRADARADLDRALTSNGRTWVEGRVHFELARLDLLDANRPQARVHLETAARLGDSDRDEGNAEKARALLREPALSR